MARGLRKPFMRTSFTKMGAGTPWGEEMLRMLVLEMMIRGLERERRRTDPESKDVANAMLNHYRQQRRSLQNRTNL